MEVIRRNELFIEYQKELKIAMCRNRRLFRALRLENDDVYQDLAVAMLKAIDGFDSTRSSSLGTHIACKLRYAVLNMKDYRPHGMKGVKRGQDVDFAYIDGDSAPALYDDNADTTPDIVVAKDLFGRLSKEERAAVRMRLEGSYLRRKTQRDALASAQRRTIAYYAVAGRVAA